MAALQFDQIPSEVEIVHERNIAKQSCNVMAELKNKRQLLYERTTRCKMIQELNREKEPTNRVKTYKFICVCPQYHPCYPCKHTGNVIIDRDILTKEEHICYLATPHIHQAAQRKMPRFYHKRILLPHATARIEVLAEPKKKNLVSVADEYKDILSKERLDKINKITSRNPDDVRYNDIPTALAYIAEDRRLKRVTMMKERAQCRRLRNRILKKQRRQIKKIICVIFEEMKDFLLNDQFLNDESSMLSKVILEQITEFTNRDFYNTSNLRDYQKILANNLAVWINKFIAALSICVARPEQPEKLPPPEPDTFLPISDYISLSGEGEDPYEAHEDNYIDIDEYEMEQDTENAKDTQNTQN